MYQELRNLLRAQPFVPFTIVMSNGVRIPVNHPENALLMKHFIYVATQGDRTAQHCYLLHVANIERDAAMTPPEPAGS